MNLEQLGFSERISTLANEQKIDPSSIARVSAEHRERYTLLSETGEYEAEITGNMRYTSTSRSDFPAVGDWVQYIPYDDEHAIIQAVLPRLSSITRQAVGQFGEIQIIASNIDKAFIVQALDRDFSINRLERYLTICYSSGVAPVIVLSKTDLVDPETIKEYTKELDKRTRDVPVILLSNIEGKGIEEVRSHLGTGVSCCVMGSSGVGKSTLINNLAGRALMETGEISSATNRGRHVTSHRQMFILNDGGILIDTPGMRELGIADSGEGLDKTYDPIVELASGCRYVDCTHTTESGCAVIEAVETGELDASSYENYLKLIREQAFFQSTLEERRKKDKEFGKMVKGYKNLKKKQRD